MKFDTPALRNPIDRLKVVGKATPRIDGPLKTTGSAAYAYEQHAAAPARIRAFFRRFVGVSHHRMKNRLLVAQNAPRCLHALDET